MALIGCLEHVDPSVITRPGVVVVRCAIYYPPLPFATHQLNLTLTLIELLCEIIHAVVLSKSLFYGLSTGFVLDDNQR